MDELMAKLNSLGVKTKDALVSFTGDAAMYLKYVREFPTEKTMGALVEAMKAKDYKQARSYAHALKGITKNLRFEPLADAAEDMIAELDDGNIEVALKEFETLKTQYAIVCDVINQNAD